MVDASHGQSTGRQPFFNLNGNAVRTRGRNAQAANIAAGKAVAESVRTTLGPNGLDKMLVSDSGDVVITNDGATILDEMNVDHPTAQMIVELADAQAEHVGDGTTTAAILSGALLVAAEELLERGVHPTTIARGYALAGEVALDALERQRLDREPDDATLRAVVTSSMTGKGTGSVDADSLAESILHAVRRVEDDDGVDPNAIDIVTRAGRSTSATEVIGGIVAEIEPCHDEMPRHVEDATVAVLTSSLDVLESRARFQHHDVAYTVNNAQQFSSAVAAEERRLDEFAQAIVDAGVDIVFLTETEDVADRTASLLAQAGVLAFGDVKDDVTNAIREMTGALPVHVIEELGEDSLGSAGTVRVEQFDGDELLFIEDGTASGPVTIFVRGGIGQVREEGERAVMDGVDAVITAIRDGIVPGAGATEVAVARDVRNAASGVASREQLVFDAFADAIETIPRTLAANAGVDPIDALTELRMKVDAKGHRGIVGSGRAATIDDPVENGVLDPLGVKREAIENAIEVATMIVRIDDVISAR